MGKSHTRTNRPPEIETVMDCGLVECSRLNDCDLIGAILMGLWILRGASVILESYRGQPQRRRHLEGVVGHERLFLFLRVTTTQPSSTSGSGSVPVSGVFRIVVSGAVMELVKVSI